MRIRVVVIISTARTVCRHTAAIPIFNLFNAAMCMRVPCPGGRVADILSLQLFAVRKCAADASPYVRKCAAVAVAKVFSLGQSAEITDGGSGGENQEQLEEILSKLLSDSSNMLVT